MAGKTDIFSDGWCEVVFAGRNKAYGAYELRKIHEKNMGLVVLFVSLLFVGVMTAPMFIGGTDEQVAAYNGPGEHLLDLPPVAPPPPINPPPPADPPSANIVENTRARIVPDDQVTRPATTPEELNGAQSGTTTSTGISPDPPNDIIVPGSGNLPVIPEAPPVIRDWAEVLPVFKGGDKELFRYLDRNLVYPREMIGVMDEATVYVEFVVYPDGSVRDVTILRSGGKSFDKETMRVYSSMPDWIPGSQNGEKVPVRMKMPVRFKMKD